MKHKQDRGSGNDSSCNSSDSSSGDNAAFAVAGITTNKLSSKEGQTSSLQSEGIQFNSFVDNFHKTNTEML